jgi:hypothetical protein
MNGVIPPQIPMLRILYEEQEGYHYRRRLVHLQDLVVQSIPKEPHKETYFLILQPG